MTGPEYLSPHDPPPHDPPPELSEDERENLERTGQLHGGWDGIGCALAGMVLCAAFVFVFVMGLRYGG